jgi:hypothetical protein
MGRRRGTQRRGIRRSKGMTRRRGRGYIFFFF